LVSGKGQSGARLEGGGLAGYQSLNKTKGAYMKVEGALVWVSEPRGLRKGSEVWGQPSIW
jgi:hypothetical protein